LLGAEHGLGRVGGIFAGGSPVAACVEKEEFRGALGEGKVCNVFAVRRWVWGSVVVCERIVSGDGDTIHLAVP
jgi:hypothetical protein